MKRLFLFILSLVLVIVLFELSYRVLYDLSHTAHNDFSAYNRPNYYFPAPYVGFKGKPNSPTGFFTEEQEPILFNSLGYRGELPSPEKTFGEFRVFVLGASAVFGDQIDFPTRLQERLHELGYKYARVYNFGTVSSGIAQDLARIVFELADLKPDLVIMYGGTNDLEHPMSHDPRPGYPYNFLLVENNPLIQKDMSRYEVLPLILFKSKFLRQRYGNYFIHKFTRIEEVRREVNYGSSEWHQSLVDSYWESHRKASAVSKAFGAHYLGVYQPMLFYKDNLYGNEQYIVNHAQRDHFIHYRELLRQKFMDFSFFDMSDALNHIHAEIFKDERHVYNQYQSEVAKILADHIIQQGLLTPSSPSNVIK